MNPYAPPLAEPDDRSDPGFKVILPSTLKVRIAGTIFAMGGVGFYAYAALHPAYHPSIAMITVVGGMQGFLPSAIVMWWKTAWLPRKLRNHPLVREGRALYGGMAMLKLDRRMDGYLFITRDSLDFWIRSASWSAGETISHPLSAITSIRRRTWLGMPVPGLVLEGPSLGVVKLTVSRPEIWKEAILGTRSTPPA